MCRLKRKYFFFLRSVLLISLTLLSSYIKITAQNTAQPDTIIKILPGTLIQIVDSVSYFSSDTLISLPGSIKSAAKTSKDKTLVFYDSLKVKASKYPLAQKLYDIVIVSPDTADKKRITDISDANYLIYSGKIIRKIDVQRLDVFGVNISNPSSVSTKKTDNILNKTHFNTNESIIRKNLLFEAGDTISPLTISDNERLLRQLSYIDDARIILVPVSEDEVDIIVLTKDVYSLGADYSYKGIKKGTASLFEKNIFGIGHELGIEVPFDSDKTDSPGFGINYLVNNISKSFINLRLYYLDGLGDKTYGFDLRRKLISSTTKYAGGISVKQMYTTEDLDTLTIPQPLKYNLQDYWLQRSFLVNKTSVSRIIIGARYTNNNVFDRPLIEPQSYYDLQKYRIFMGSAALSVQKYYKTNLIYGYGRTEDIPYGGLLKITAGKEKNEFKNRTYLGIEGAYGKSSRSLGYFYSSAGFATFVNNKMTEQGILSLKLKYFSNLMSLGKSMVRTFVYADYTRGFDRYTDETITFIRDYGFSGFRNDSVNGTQRLSLNIESVLFSPTNLYGFRFAFFSFADFSFLCESNEVIGSGNTLTGIGLGIRIRNDNLVFNTFQFRFGFFPNHPEYSRITHFLVSGEQLLKPNNFNSGPPSIIPYE